MQLMKCKWCGKPFQSIGLSFCHRCLQELDEQYKPVRDYLYDNPNATIDEVMEATGVPQRVILYYLRDGRLRMANASGLLRCEQCGDAIDSGRLCDKCSNKVEERMLKPIRRSQDRAKQAQDNGSRMYTYKDR